MSGGVLDGAETAVLDRAAEQSGSLSAELRELLLAQPLSPLRANNFRVLSNRPKADNEQNVT
jgi:hypothetical protein